MIQAYTKPILTWVHADYDLTVCGILCRIKVPPVRPLQNMQSVRILLLRGLPRFFDSVGVSTQTHVELATLPSMRITEYILISIIISILIYAHLHLLFHALSLWYPCRPKRWPFTSAFPRRFLFVALPTHTNVYMGGNDCLA